MYESHIIINYQSQVYIKQHAKKLTPYGPQLQNFISCDRFDGELKYFADIHTENIAASQIDVIQKLKQTNCLLTSFLGRTTR